MIWKLNYWANLAQILFPCPNVAWHNLALMLDPNDLEKMDLTWVSAPCSLIWDYDRLQKLCLWFWEGGSEGGREDAIFDKFGAGNDIKYSWITEETKILNLSAKRAVDASWENNIWHHILRLGRIALCNTCHKVARIKITFSEVRIVNLCVTVMMPGFITFYAF